MSVSPTTTNEKKERPMTSGDSRKADADKNKRRPRMLETIAGAAVAATVGGVAMNACSSGPEVTDSVPACERRDSDGDGVYQCEADAPRAGYECQAVVTRTEVGNNEEADAGVNDASVDADQSMDADVETAETGPEYVESVECQWVAVESTDAGVLDSATDADENTCESERACEEDNALRGEALSAGVSYETNEDGERVEVVTPNDVKTFGPLEYSVAGHTYVERELEGTTQTVVAAVLNVVNSCDENNRVVLVPGGEGRVRDGNSEFVFSATEVEVETDAETGEVTGVALVMDVDENCVEIVNPDAGPDADVQDGSPDADQEMDGDADMETPDADMESPDADEELVPDADMSECEGLYNGSGTASANPAVEGEDPEPVAIGTTGIGMIVRSAEYPDASVQFVRMDDATVELTDPISLVAEAAGGATVTRPICGVGTISAELASVWGNRATVSATVSGVE